jgi:hypothetical protein
MLLSSLTLTARLKGYYIFLKINVPFVPPKPKELLIAISTLASRAVFGT